MNITEAAARAGTSVRTLRYYEEMGLIQPKRDAENNYREYDEATVRRIRLVRAYRELQFSLEEIRTLLNAGRMERDAALEKQISALEKKRRIIDNRIALAHSLRMMGPERLTEIDFSAVDEQMEQSRKSLENNEEWQKLSERMKEKSKEASDAMAEELLNCLSQVANAGEEELPDAVNALRSCIEEHFYPCTDLILKSYARAFGGDGLLAQALEAKAGPGAPERLKEKLERWMKAE